MAGKRVKCPACGVAVQIPKAGEKAASIPKPKPVESSGVSDEDVLGFLTDGEPAGSGSQEASSQEVHAKQKPATKSPSKSHPRPTDLPASTQPSMAPVKPLAVPSRKKVNVALLAALAGGGGLVVLIVVGVVVWSFFGSDETFSTAGDQTADVPLPSQRVTPLAQPIREEIPTMPPRDWSLTEEERSALVRYDLGGGLGLTMLEPRGASAHNHFPGAVCREGENVCRVRG
jgi:hypothetical protein